MKKLLSISIIVSCLISESYTQTIITSQIPKHGAPDSCIFCHTPISGNSNVIPVWNKIAASWSSNVGSYTSITNKDVGSKSYIQPPTTSYQIYNNSSTNSPSTASLVCLSCHDGVNAEMQLSTSAKLGIDLSNDHPISIPYPSSHNSSFFRPPDHIKGWPDLPLYEGKVECGTCHNVHGSSYPAFLRIPNTQSALCLRCHNK